MNIFRHTRNGAILATTDTHAVYIPISAGMTTENQLQDADYHLTNKSSRCFILCDEPGKEVVEGKPTPSDKNQDLELATFGKN